MHEYTEKEHHYLMQFLKFDRVRRLLLPGWTYKICTNISFVPKQLNIITAVTCIHCNFRYYWIHFENKINNTHSFWEKYPHPHSHNAIFILRIKSTTHTHFGRNIHILIHTIRPATTPQCYFHFENKINCIRLSSHFLFVMIPLYH